MGHVLARAQCSNIIANPTFDCTRLAYSNQEFADGYVSPWEASHGRPRDLPDNVFPAVSPPHYCFLYAGFLVGAGPNDGWFNYVPYAERQYNPGLNQDFYALGMVFLGISTTIGAANFIVTVLNMRAPGMTLMAATLAAVVAWYAALLLGYVHSIYVFTPA